MEKVFDTHCVRSELNQIKDDVDVYKKNTSVRYKQGGALRASLDSGRSECILVHHAGCDAIGIASIKLQQVSMTCSRRRNISPRRLAGMHRGIYCPNS